MESVPEGTMQFNLWPVITQPIPIINNIITTADWSQMIRLRLTLRLLRWSLGLQVVAHVTPVEIKSYLRSDNREMLVVRLINMKLKLQLLLNCKIDSRMCKLR